MQIHTFQCTILQETYAHGKAEEIMGQAFQVSAEQGGKVH